MDSTPTDDGPDDPSPDIGPDEPTPDTEPEHPEAHAVAPDAAPPRRTALIVGAAIAVVAVVVIVVIVALSGGGDPSPKVSTADEPASTSTAPPTTLEARTLTPFSDEPTVACGIGSTAPFPASVLNGPTGAEKGSSPAAKALRADLDGPNGGYFDNGGKLKVWRLAVQTDADAYFLGGDGAQRYFQRYELKGGRWRWVIGGSCVSTTVIEPGLNAVALNLGDDQGIDASTTTVRLQVTELICNGGASLTKNRIVGPQVHLEADRVVIAMAARKPPGASKSCVAAQPVEVTVHLGEPLGSRPLLNGNRFPYRLIS